MADIFRFTDPDNDATVRLDISTLIDANRELVFGVPDLSAGRRIIEIPFILNGASKQALNNQWRDVVEQVELASALEVQLEGSSGGSVWFDQLVTEEERPFAAEDERSTVQSLYTWQEGRRNYMRAIMTLVCAPYARGAETTPVSAGAIASAPNASNFVDISAPAGDVEAPAQIELVYGTTPNRLLQRIARRTTGTVANYVSLHEAESATLGGTTVSQAEAAASNGNSTRTTPTNQDMTLTHTWAVSTNLADKTGAIDVYVKIKDRDTTPGQLKARLDLRLASGLDVTGDTYTITVDADHDGTTSPSYELWYLGAYHIPVDAAAHDWRLHLQRTVGTATVDVDYIALMPADESVGILSFTSTVDISGSSSRTFTVDTESGLAWWGTSTSRRASGALLGRGIWLKPGVTNRLIVQASSDTHTTIDEPPSIIVDDLTSITVRYRPRFLWVR